MIDLHMESRVDVLLRPKHFMDSTSTLQMCQMLGYVTWIVGGYIYPPPPQKKKSIKCWYMLHRLWGDYAALSLLPESGH